MRTSLSKYMTCSWRELAFGRVAHRRPVLLAREQLLEVVTGREVLALGGEHDDAHVVVGVGAVERGVELVDQPAVLRVGRVGPGQRDRRDRPVDRVANRLERAGVTRRMLAAAARSPAYVTVSVPCICEWMLQWNLYVPALRAR